ncbi:MAG: outer membrane beta-barrel protein [Flavobacteriales bacterium]|nr:outer membrane beta-barrel protein [Flavobacteriales bacterium]
MKKILSILVSIAALTTVQAQYDTDFGGRLGMSVYAGDIAGVGASKPDPGDIQLRQAGLNVGLSVRRFVTPMVAVRGEFNYGIVKGSDKLSSEPSRYSRNLSFKTSLMELSGRLEVHPLQIKDLGHTYRSRMDFSAFLFAGLGMTYFNPKAEYNGSYVNLQPLKTEGFSYSLITPVVPLGIGMEFRLNKHHIIGWDLGVRMTMTDYIDDISTRYVHHTKFTDPTALALQDRSIEYEGTGDPLFVGSENYSYGSDPVGTAPRGNPDNNDWYGFSSITYSWAKRNKRKSFSRRKYSWVSAKVKRRRSKAKF